MGRFHFRALGPDGRVETGLLDGPSTDAVAAAIRGRGALPIRVAPATGGHRAWALLQTDVTPRAALSARERVALAQSLATLLEAGVPIDRALALSRDLGGSRRARRVAGRLLERMTGGASLADALAEEGSAFPPLFVGIVRGAEASATLAPALARLARSEEEAARRSTALRSALVYPAFLIATGVGCMVVLLAYVVPSFEPMLERAGRELPAITRAVMAAADAARTLAPPALPLLLLAAAGAQLALRRPGVRAAWHRLLLRLPVVGPVRRKLASAALARGLGEALGGGVDLPRALRLASDGVADAAIRARVAAAAPRVEAGEGLGRAFAEGGLLAPLTVQLMEVGERSGRLPEMLLRSADMLDEEARTTLDRLMALLTPALTLAMGAAIALVVGSILSALLSLNDLAAS
jgi:general secretion pathway protein F